MKLNYIALLLFTAFGIDHVNAQPLQALARSSFVARGQLFSIKGIPYQSQIDGEAIASSPDWHIENTPPVDTATAAKTTRRQLKELVEDEASQVSLPHVNL